MTNAPFDLLACLFYRRECSFAAWQGNPWITIPHIYILIYFSFLFLFNTNLVNFVLYVGMCNTRVKMCEADKFSSRSAWRHNLTLQFLPHWVLLFLISSMCPSAGLLGVSHKHSTSTVHTNTWTLGLLAAKKKKKGSKFGLTLSAVTTWFLISLHCRP